MANRRLRSLCLTCCTIIVVIGRPILSNGQGVANVVQTDATVQRAVQEKLHVGKFTVQELEAVKKPGELEMGLNIAGEDQLVVLQKYSIRGPGFRVMVQDSSGGFREAAVPEVQTYRGYIVGFGGSSVTASIADGKIRAFVRMGDANDSTWVIEPLQNVLSGGSAGQHVVYKSEDVEQEDGVCGNQDMPYEKAPIPKEMGNGSVSLDVTVCEIACDADYEFYQSEGNSVPNTVADIETIINGVSAVYERDTKVSFQITQILVRSAEPDPYTSTNSSTLLGEFRLEWRNNHQDIQRDIAQLFTGKNMGTPIGNSYVNQICPGSDHYSVVRSRWSTDIGKRIALSAHEIGHNFNLYHCDGDQWCRIMCSALGGCSGGYYSFEPASITTIRNMAASSYCMTAGTVTTPTTSLPFFDDFSYASGGLLKPPDSTKWTAVDLTGCEYGRLEISLSRGFDNLEKLGTVRTFPMQLSGPAVVTYKAAWDIAPPSGYSLKVEYFNSATYTWKLLRAMNPPQYPYAIYIDNIPTDGFGNYFAIRFSAYKEGWASFATRTLEIDDVAVTSVDFNNDGEVNFIDWAIFANAWMTTPASPAWNPICDLNGDSAINLFDLSAFAAVWLAGTE